MIAYARAKINLALRVGQKRADGFHEIETLFTETDLKDRLTFSPSPRIRVTVHPPVAPAGPRNLAYRAAMEIKKRYGIRGGISIRIDKKIPVGGGLGGGSANAAAVVKFLLKHWKIREKPAVLLEILTGLGSDVPFCYWGGTAVGSGRGEKLRPVPPFPRYHLVLVHPGFGVSTAEAYGDLRRNLTPPDKKVKLYRRYSAFLKKKVPLRALLENDFETTVFKRHPLLQSLRLDFEAFQPEGALMSGSGATVYALFKHRRDAAAAATFFKRKGLWVCHTGVFRGTRRLPNRGGQGGHYRG